VSVHHLSGSCFSGSTAYRGLQRWRRCHPGHLPASLGAGYRGCAAGRRDDHGRVLFQKRLAGLTKRDLLAQCDPPGAARGRFHRSRKPRSLPPFAAASHPSFPDQCKYLQCHRHTNWISHAPDLEICPLFPGGFEDRFVRRDATAGHSNDLFDPGP